MVNSIDVQWFRDKAGRPTVRRTIQNLGRAAAMATAMAGAATSQPAQAEPPRMVEQRNYTWRGEDQIASIAHAWGPTRTFDHDARGRLIRERRGETEILDRAMDAVGNVYRTADGHDRRYGPGGRIEQAEETRFEHDEDGNLVLRSGPDGDWHYQWNGHGLLTQVERPDGTKVRFQYDALARRIGKTVLDEQGDVSQETTFVWDGHVVVHEIGQAEGIMSWHWEPESSTPIAEAPKSTFQAHTEPANSNQLKESSNDNLCFNCRVRLPCWRRHDLQRHRCQA